MRLPERFEIITDLTEQDRISLRLELDAETIRNDLASPTMKKILAEMKNTLRQNQQSFFTGRMGLPPGLIGASPREAFLVGLVTFGQMMLAYIEGLRYEGKPSERNGKEPVPDPFREGIMK